MLSSNSTNYRPSQLKKPTLQAHCL